LPGGGESRREAQAVDHVVEAALQDLQEALAGAAPRLAGKVQVAAELALLHAVEELELLLLQELPPVLAHPAAGAVSVLSRRIGALQRRALRRAAEGLPDPAAHTVLRPCVPSHLVPSCLGVPSLSNAARAYHRGVGRARDI